MTKSPTYLRCPACGWTDRTLDLDKRVDHIDCPKCSSMLCRKKTQHKSSPTYRGKKSGRKRAISFQVDDGYKAKPTVDGWVFTEGKRKLQSLWITNAETESLNACLRRRGLDRTRSQVTWKGKFY